MTPNEIYLKWTHEVLPELLIDAGLDVNSSITINLLSQQRVHTHRDVSYADDLELAVGVIVDAFLEDILLGSARLIVDSMFTAGHFASTEIDGVLGHSTSVARLGQSVMQSLAEKETP